MKLSTSSSTLAIFLTLVALQCLLTLSESGDQIDVVQSDSSSLKPQPDSIKRVSDPYIQSLMKAENKCVIVAIRHWYKPPLVVVTTNNETYEVAPFGHCIKGWECYGIADPQEVNWPFSLEKRFVFVVPANADHVSLNGVEVEPSPNVILFRHGQVSQHLFPEKPHTVSVVLTSRAALDSRVMLKWVTDRSSNFDAVEMSPLESADERFHAGAEIVIPHGAKLTRIYAGDNTLLFDHHRPIKSATGLFLESPDQIIQYVTGKRERAQVLDFSPVDKNQYYLSKITYYKMPHLAGPQYIMFVVPPKLRFEYFSPVYDLEAPLNSTKPSKWVTHIYLKEPPSEPFNIIVVDATTFFEVPAPTVSGNYIVDPKSRTLISETEVEL